MRRSVRGVQLVHRAYAICRMPVAGGGVSWTNANARMLGRRSKFGCPAMHLIQPSAPAAVTPRPARPADAEPAVLTFGVAPATAATLGAKPTVQLEPGIFQDPAHPALFFARCPCGEEATTLSLGKTNGDPNRRRGARGVLQTHGERCGRLSSSVEARAKAREVAFGKKPPAATKPRTA